MPGMMKNYNLAMWAQLVQSAAIMTHCELDSGAGSLTSNVAVSIENPGLPYRYKSVTFKVISTATYTVTVNNGSGGGEYAAGASVTITANARAAANTQQARASRSRQTNRKPASSSINGLVRTG